MRLVYVLAAVLGVLYGYDFGRVIGGPLVGVVLALNGAVFCSIVAGALAERLCQGRPAALQPRRPFGHLNSSAARCRPRVQALLVLVALVRGGELPRQPEREDDAPDDEQDVMDLHGMLLQRQSW